MITAQLMTFLTVVAGPALAGLFCIWFRMTVGRWSMPMQTLLGIVANAMSLVPLGCVILNIVHTTYIASFRGKEAIDPPPLSASISGSETTIFLALLYAMLMILNAVYRTIIDHRPFPPGLPLSPGSPSGAFRAPEPTP